MAWTIAREIAGSHYGVTPPVQLGTEIPRDVAIVLKHIAPLFAYKKRMEWLHDCSTGDVDPEGFEWGIYRVKWENGQPVQVWQTNSDFSDLDAEMQRELSAQPERRMNDE